MVYVNALLWTIVGVIIGIFIIYLKSYEKPIGIIIVDDSEPDTEPYLYLSISGEDLNNILDKKQVTLHVSKYSEADSQK